MAKVRIFYKSTIQNRDNPDPEKMYYKVWFSDPLRAAVWLKENDCRIKDVFIFSEQIKLEVKIVKSND